MALVFIVGLGGWWLARGHPNPLARASTRENTVREDAVALAVCVYLLAVLVLGGVTELLFDEPDGTPALLLTGTGAQLAGVGVCCFVAATRFSGGVKRFLVGKGDTRPGTKVGLIVVCVIVAVGLCPLVVEGTHRLFEFLVPGYQATEHPTIEALRQDDQPFVVVAGLWMGAAVVAPVAEELFFRGLVQTLLANLMAGRWVPLLITSLIFGLVHFSQPQAVPALIVLAVLLGYAYERTGSVLVPVMIHALFNAKTLIWDALGAYAY